MRWNDKKEELKRFLFGNGDTILSVESYFLMMKRVERR
jgi:hypothetical protein